MAAAKFLTRDPAVRKRTKKIVVIAATSC